MSFLQRGDAEVAPSYWEDKRSMPLLPWLPASRKKRFPVTKRSPKVNENELSHSSAAAGDNDKISQDLKGIFGDNSADSDDDKKKKRSMDEMMNNGEHEQHSSMMAPHHSHDSSHDDKKRNLKKRSPTENDDDEEEPDNENGNFTLKSYIKQFLSTPMFYYAIK